MSVKVVDLEGGCARFLTDFQPTVDVPESERRIAVTVMADRVVVIVQEHTHNPHCTETSLGVALSREDWDVITDMVAEVRP